MSWAELARSYSHQLRREAGLGKKKAGPATVAEEGVESGEADDESETETETEMYEGSESWETETETDGDNSQDDGEEGVYLLTSAYFTIHVNRYRVRPTIVSSVMF